LAWSAGLREATSSWGREVGIGILRSALIFVSAVAFLLAGFNVAGNAIGLWDPLKPRGTDASLAARPPGVRARHVGDPGSGARTIDLARRTPHSPVSVHLALLIAFASLGLALLPTVSPRSMDWIATRTFRLRRGPSRRRELRARASWLSELPSRSRGRPHASSAPAVKWPEALPRIASKAPAHTVPEAPAHIASKAPAHIASKAPAHTGPTRSSVGLRGETDGERLPELDLDRVKCGHCGYEAAQADRFCAHCGASLGEARPPRSLVVIPTTETSGWELCEIDCWHGYVKCDFYARGLMPAGDAEVGRSLPFWWWHRDPPPQEGRALAAHQALVERLLADGWVPTGARRPWYAQRFRRSLDDSHAPAPEDVPALQSSSKVPASP